MSQANLTRAEAQKRAELLDVQSYDVHLHLTPEDDAFTSRTVIHFNCVHPGAGCFVDLAAQSVKSASLNGTALSLDSWQGRRLQLDDLRRTNVLEVEALFPYSNTGQGMHRFKDPLDQETYVYSDMQPFHCHEVFACFDQPDLKAEFEFSVKIPPGWVAVSNMSALEQPAEDAGGLWRFKRTPRMSTYLALVAAGPFAIFSDSHRDTALSVYCRRSLAQYLDPDAIFGDTKVGLDFFEEIFDYPYPFGDKYDHLFVPEFVAGAMENPGAVTMSEYYIFRSKVTEATRQSRTETILHELSHMWFGNLVTMSWWDDLWLNESFATYISNHAIDSTERWANAWTFFNAAWKAGAYVQDQLPTTHPIAADAPDVSTAESNFDAISYAKGASVLKQLVAWVGEEAFVKGIRRYFRDLEFSNATLADFLAALERSSGRDLKAWSKEWLETAGVNIISVDFDTYEGKYRTFSIVQEVPDEWSVQRSHRIGIGLYDLKDGRLARRQYLETDAVGPRTEVSDLSGSRIADLVLPNDGDLAYARIRLDPVSLQTAQRSLHLLEDSLARSLCWSASWDMVRSAELSASRYVDLVLNNVGYESEISLVQTCINRASTCVFHYCAPTNQGRLKDRLSSWLLERARAADPGTDLQLTWSMGFVQFATSAEHIEILRSLLDGSTEIPGLTIDFARRWQIVRRLCAVGEADESLIAAELEREPTSQAERNAETARAMIPTHQAKRWAWELAAEQVQTPRATLLALAMGFMHPEQSELLRPYGERYFEVVEQVWTSRPREVADVFADVFFPSNIIDKKTVEAADRLLEKPDLEPALRRKVIEGRESIARSLRARACDSADGGPVTGTR